MNALQRLAVSIAAYLQRFIRMSDLFLADRVSGIEFLKSLRLSRKVAFLVGGGIVFCDRNDEQGYFQSSRCTTCGCRQHETT